MEVGASAGTQSRQVLLDVVGVQAGELQGLWRIKSKDSRRRSSKSTLSPFFEANRPLGEGKTLPHIIKITVFWQDGGGGGES